MHFTHSAFESSSSSYICSAPAVFRFYLFYFFFQFFHVHVWTAAMQLILFKTNILFVRNEAISNMIYGSTRQVAHIQPSQCEWGIVWWPIGPLHCFVFIPILISISIFTVDCDYAYKLMWGLYAICVLLSSAKSRKIKIKSITINHKRISVGICWFHKFELPI